MRACEGYHPFPSCTAPRTTSSLDRKNMTSFTRVLIALVVSACSVGAFVPSPAAFRKTDHRTIDAASSATQAITRPSRQHVGPLFMGWGDALGKAFANEDMAPMKNPGLKSEPNTCMVRVFHTAVFLCLKFEATEERRYDFESDGVNFEYVCVH